MNWPPMTTINVNNNKLKEKSAKNDTQNSCHLHTDVHYIHIHNHVFSVLITLTVIAFSVSDAACNKTIQKRTSKAEGRARSERFTDRLCCHNHRHAIVLPDSFTCRHTKIVYRREQIIQCNIRLPKFGIASMKTSMIPYHQLWLSTCPCPTFAGNTVLPMHDPRVLYNTKYHCKTTITDNDSLSKDVHVYSTAVRNFKFEFLVQFSCVCLCV